MPRIAIKNAKIITPLEKIDNGIILINGQLIEAVGPADEISIPKNIKIIDTLGLIACPGFIDLHIHGAKGFDFIDADSVSITEILKYHFYHGTMSLLATLIIESDSKIKDVLREVMSYENDI